MNVSAFRSHCSLRPSSRDDTIIGTGGSDWLDGADGDDTITAGPTGGTTLFGSGGNDTFIARNSVIDDLRGGDGADSATADADDLLDSIEQT